MKKVISYKAAQPPFGIDGSLSLRNTVNSRVVDNVVYTPYESPFTEARCVFLNDRGAIIALAVPSDGPSGIAYKSFVVSALLSQAWILRGTFTKVISSFDPALSKYIDGLTDSYDPINNPDVRTQSIYTKAAVEIDNSLSKAMTADDGEIIEFNYEIDYFPSILDNYATSAGNWFKTKNREFYDPFAADDTGRMNKIYQPVSDLGTAARAGSPDNNMQEVDGSFTSFWPIAQNSSEFAYSSAGLNDLILSGITTLEDSRAEQAQIWEEQYAG